ncbi:MAG: hypothetical protein Q8O72_03275 [Bacteroidales bacterium]|jgi:hypothetical protein|nr:hypothetical protein [Bacteroidales bacterium]
MSKKQWFIIGVANLLLIVGVSFFINYAYSKLFWKNKVSIYADARAEDAIADQKDTLTEAYIGKSYKIGTAFEVFKKNDPLLKIVSGRHGALELAVASGENHFSDLAQARDAVIRKVGEGNLILSIPSYTGHNQRSIIFGNESKAFLTLNNSNQIIIDTRNFSIDKEGLILVKDLILKDPNMNRSLTSTLFQLNNSLIEAQNRIDKLEDDLLTLEQKMKAN